MSFELTILGSNSAVPAYGRHPSAQLLKYESERFLIDCGEGTQFRLTQYKVKRSNLNHIFISHLHGDHYFGLVGLINSMRMSGRKDELFVYGPPELEAILHLQIDLKDTSWGFPVHFIPLKEGENKVIMDLPKLQVSTIPLDHKGMLCNGFLFEEKTKPRRINGELIKKLKVPYPEIQAIKEGGDFIDSDGAVYSYQALTQDPLPSYKYAYCSDTKYNESIIPIIEGVDVLYHEATFMETEKDKADLRGHSTAKQAATMASKAKVGKLLLGHFSARYFDLNALLEEGRTVFPSSELALEGTKWLIS